MNAEPTVRRTPRLTERAPRPAAPPRGGGRYSVSRAQGWGGEGLELQIEVASVQAATSLYKSRRFFRDYEGPCILKSESKSYPACLAVLLVWRQELRLSVLQQPRVDGWADG